MSTRWVRRSEVANPAEISWQREGKRGGSADGKGVRPLPQQCADSVAEGELGRKLEDGELGSLSAREDHKAQMAVEHWNCTD